MEQSLNQQPVQAQQPEQNAPASRVADFVGSQTDRIEKKPANCIVGIILLALFLIFLVFGNKIFGFFNLQNIYHFIIAILVLLILYIASLVVIGLFVKYPTDIITLEQDRDRKSS